MKIKNTKLLFLYRSPLFKFTKFKTDNKDLIDITEALNIKKRKQRITYIYDKAIEYINNYYTKDLCQFKDNMCIAARVNHTGLKNGCCRLCMYQNNKGCKVNNISCKLFYCETALKNIKKLEIKDIPILKVLSPTQRFMLQSCFFTKREDVINDLYYGILISTVRLTIRMIKQYKYVKKRS